MPDPPAGERDLRALSERFSEAEARIRALVAQAPEEKFPGIAGDRCAADHLHTMCVHWRGSPLPLALFPPPSLTPRTASMPRSVLRTARFRLSFVVGLLASRPSSPAPLATLRRSRVCLALWWTWPQGI